MNIRDILLLGLALLLSACTTSHFDPPEIQGRPALVDDAGDKRLWVLSKQEESRQVSVGGSNRSSGRWRTDTYFHFSIKAFDPLTAQPAWTQRLVTLGDAKARGTTPSRVIGSDVEAQMLGQDGELVWLLIGNAPYAVSAHDGHVVGDAVAIEKNNPALVGLLPVESKYFGFDGGLVLMTADARQMVIRGADLKASDYVARAIVAPEPEREANGRERIVPMRPPIGEVPARTATLGGQWLGLYTEREAADALHDEFGTRFRYPYTVLDEGAQARRTFHRGTVVQAQRFDERFPRLGKLEPIAGAPVYLKGRFFKDPSKIDTALTMTAPDGLMVWHSTRIDQAGRLALTRLDAELKPVWEARLPLSETGTINPVSTWLLPGRLVVMGDEESVKDGVTSRVPHLVSVDLGTGEWKGWDLVGEKKLP
ncbi:PA2928 family protein [Arenimonas oryziterrae]|uniref:PA2928 family protein n=1 Tax=Arenimonas oryziterrae TaxID=498055 RepID=UPI000526865A|nr:PA2928 family protein [Arenimonas oryziterrae]